MTDKSQTGQSEWLLESRDEPARKYLLRLYVTGSTPKSLRAIKNLRKICEEHLRGQYDLVVIDLHQLPQLAAGEQIIALPTLIKELPAPLRRIIGDMSNTERVLLGLDIRPRKAVGFAP